MGIPCLIVILCIQLLTSQQSWIFEKEVPANDSFKKIVAIDRQLLIAQTIKDLYVAPYHNPNLIKQTVASNIPQRIEVAGGNKGLSYLYELNNCIQYKQADSLWHSQLKQMQYPRSFIKIKELLYFYAPNISPYLLIYNTLSGQISMGPYLIAREQIQLSLAFQINPVFNHLIVVVDSTIFFIDLNTMEIINAFTNGIYAQKIEIMVSPEGKYVTHNNMAFREIFMYDPKTKQYSLIYRFVQDGSEYQRYGFAFNEEDNYCYQIMMKKEDTIIIRHIVEMDCSKPYDQIKDKLGNYDYLIRYLDRRNRDQLYSYGQVGSLIVYNRHQIMENQFIWLQQLQYPFEVNITITQILKVSQNRQKMVIYDQQKCLIIWDLSSSSKKCQNQINENVLLKNRVRQAFFDIFSKEVFFVLEILENIMAWIDLETCQIKSQDYGNKIQTIFFMNNRNNISVLTDRNEFFLIDQISKQVQQKFILQTAPNIVFEDCLYGVLQNSSKFFLRKYDESFKVANTVQVNCQSLQVKLKTGAEHLSVICGNQYNVYGSNLQYLGSSQINVESSSYINSVEETYSPFLRVDLRLGQLHYNILNKWIFSVDTEGFMITPDSNFYFYNKTDLISLGKDKERYYLSQYNFVDNRLIVLVRISIDLKTSQGFTIIPNVRWSCNKKFILVKYTSIKDNGCIYINAYEMFTFRLVYSHRLDHSAAANNGLPTDQFNAYLDCDNLLTISTYGKVQYINLNKSSTILLESYSNISYFSIGSDSKSVMLYGKNNRKSYVLEIRSILTNQIIKNQIEVDYEEGIKMFFTESLFILNKNILYEINQDESKVIKQQIADCDYFQQTSIICLTLNNSLVVVNNIQTRLITLKIANNLMTNIISKDDFLILHNSDQVSFYESFEPFNILQTILFQQSKLDSISISPDFRRMIAYDSLSKKFTYWNKGVCPLLSQLRNGRCICVQEENQGVCACREGRFESQGECLDCEFYCKQCTSTAGNCKSLSTAGILMITAIAVVFIFGVIAAGCWLKKRRVKKTKIEAMSTLLEEINTE